MYILFSIDFKEKIKGCLIPRKNKNRHNEGDSCFKTIILYCDIFLLPQGELYELC